MMEVRCTVEDRAGPIAKALLATFPDDMPRLRGEVNLWVLPAQLDVADLERWIPLS